MIVPPPWLQHGRRRGPADQEAGKAARPPGLLEQLLGNIEDAAPIPDADIEDDQGWRSEFIVTRSKTLVTCSLTVASQE